MDLNPYNKRLLDDFYARDRRPTGVMIQVSARCNLGCKMCGYVGRTPNIGFIDPALFSQILEDCRSYGIHRITMVTAWGEPMLHPGIFELLELAQDFQIVLSTNVTPLNRRRIERLSTLSIALLQLSFCGFDRASYEGVYVGGNFDHVVENLRLIQQIFSERSPNTTLLVNGVSLRDDEDFVAKTVKFLKEIGFRDDQMEIKLPNNFGGLYAGSPTEPIRGLHTYKNLEGVSLDICTVLLDNPGIYIDGRVTACGCLDNSSALIIGDIRKETLREMRYGQRFEAMLQAFIAGDVSSIPLCRNCDVPYCNSRMVTYVSPATLSDPAAIDAAAQL